MLESLSIKNFRNFRSLQIESLSRVNLVVGKNNAGKSNLLDAIALLKSQGAPELFISLMEARRECRLMDSRNVVVYRESLRDSLASFFYGRNLSFDPANEVVISSNEHDGYIKMRFVYAVVSKEGDPAWENVTPFSLSDQVGRPHSIVPFSDGSRVSNARAWFLLQTKTYGLTSWCVDLFNPLHNSWSLSPLDPYLLQYVKTQFVHNRSNAEFWDEIDLTNKEDYALDAIRLLLPGISRLSYKSDSGGERIPYAKLRSHDTPIPLHSQGEGVDRILTLILHLVSAENGTLLIDEFENGLHYTIQEPLWRMIFQVAEKLNVQVFATTHSEDCLRAYTEVLKDSGRSDQGKVLRLAKVKDDILCSSYDSLDMEEVLEKGMEVR